MHKYSSSQALDLVLFHPIKLLFNVMRLFFACLQEASHVLESFNIQN